MKIRLWRRRPAQPVAPTGPYTGRLTFDPDSEFHADADGNKVVTEDGGKTWRYARQVDPSHNARYQRRVLTINSTTDEDFEAGDLAHAHHNDKPELPLPAVAPDVEAPFVTSHTQAWKEGA